MPSVDLETLLCGRADSYVAFEPQIFVSSHELVVSDPDLPPESFQVPIRDDVRWEKLSKVLDRRESTIGNANPKSCRSSSKPKTGSQRLNAGRAIKPNGQIVVLPNQTGFHGSVSSPLPTVRIFPSKLTKIRKPAVPEPGSPKVSCFGNVLLERERKLCRRRSDEEVEPGTRFWACLAAILRYSGGCPAVAGELESGSSTNSSGKGSEEAVKSGTVSVDATAPELQGMKRYASGRRPASWAGDVDIGFDEHVVSLEPLDRECPLRRS